MACEPYLPAADEVSARPGLIKTATAGPVAVAAIERSQASAPKEVAAPGPAEPDRGALVWTALALMAGIAVRRYVVGRR